MLTGHACGIDSLVRNQYYWMKFKCNKNIPEDTIPGILNIMSK